MKTTKKNLKVAQLIAGVLEQENCTVDETKEILHYIISIAGVKSTVQIRDVISELREEAKKADPAEIH